MAHWKKAFPSKYLQAADLDTPAIVTIKGVTTENVGTGDTVEPKLVARFTDADVKGCVLNLTRAEATAGVAGSEDTERWPGTRIRLSRGWTRYQAKRVPCIVIDAPPAQPDVEPPTDTSEAGF